MVLSGAIFFARCKFLACEAILMQTEGRFWRL